MKINSTEVAKKAGVSRSTVSRVINNNPNVIESTRNKVLRVIEELNYTPNTNAQTLAGKVSSVIGLFIVETSYTPKAINSVNFEYFMNFVSKLSEEVFRHKHQLLIDVVYNLESENRVKSLFQNGNISGGVFIGSPMHNQFIDDFITKDNKIALIDYSTNQSLISNNVSLINTNNLYAAEKITKDLIKTGSRRILHIAGNLIKLPGAQRLEGYKNAIKNSDIAFDKDLIAYGNFTERSGYEAVIECLENNIKFDAIFAANDLMAWGAKVAIQKSGLKDIPIWGFDNLQESVPIGIMTVDTCMEESAVKAVKSLLTPSEESMKVQYAPIRMVKSMDDYLNRFNASHENF